MEFFKPNTKINFMGQRKRAAIFSCVLFLFSLISFVVYGLNLGLDFTGGTQIVVNYSNPADFSQIREQITAAGFKEAIVQPYGSARDVLIRVAPRKDITQTQLTNQVVQALPGGKVQEVQYIGPQVGQALITNGILAIIVSLLATMAYIALRFDYRFAIAAAIALIHDPVLILGIFSFFHLEFNLIVLAAVLTIIGYSLNDTIVVYDRVRENFRKMRKSTPIEIMNASINQTLSRTIMTSGLTLLVVVALLIFGGEMLRGFSTALIIGIVVGTYSSIYVAGTIAVAMGLDRAHFLPQQKAVDDSP